MTDAPVLLRFTAPEPPAGQRPDRLALVCDGEVLLEVQEAGVALEAIYDGVARSVRDDDGAKPVILAPLSWLRPRFGPEVREALDWLSGELLKAAHKGPPGGAPQ